MGRWQSQSCCLPFCLNVMGVLAGAVSVVKLIRAGLSHYRVQMIYFFLGMMAGSLHSIWKKMG
ncbi:MAG: DUF368 domain-containing protein [Eubacteriales bacterium]|nr:DUF368 domain-containing protein [Eubacteriales bacterium]